MNREHAVAAYMQPFFHHYLADLRGLSDRTIIAYRDAIKILLCFAAQTLEKPVDALTVEDLDDKLLFAFLDYLEKGRNCSVRTRNARLAAVRTLFNFIGREEPVLLAQSQRVRSIPQKRVESRTVDYLDEREMKAVFNSVAQDSRTGVRDKALLLALYNTGARVHEIICVQMRDLRMDTLGQVRLLEKGRKVRICPLWPETVCALRAYIAVREPRDAQEQNVFLNANGYPITRFGVRHIVRKYASAAAGKCESIKVKKVGPHTFRHSTAMHMIRAGNDINMVSYPKESS